MMVLPAVVAGCAPSQLSSARQKIAAGDYAAARGELLAIPMSNLSDSQRREVKDDLCLTDFMIGEPTYSLTEQRRVCVEASHEAGSQSAQFIARIDAATLESSSRKVDAALAKGDLASAEQAALIYVNTPGGDPAVVAKWSRKMWELVARQDYRSEHRHKSNLNVAIAAVRKLNPSMRKMSKDAFVQWVAKQGTVEGATMFSSVALKDKELDLTIGEPQLHTAALKLDRLTTINDGTVARCGCDGRTNVGIAETNFPLYLVRLDPETRQSEVLILPHRQ